MLVVLALSGLPARATAVDLADEPTSVQQGAFLVPNERRFALLQPILAGRRGALVAVGSFRALHAAAMGSFDLVVQFDYDAVITRFNRAHLRLLREAPDRVTYLARLFSRSGMAEGLSEAELFARLRGVVPAEVNLPPEGADHVAVELGAVFREPVDRRSLSRRLLLLAEAEHHRADPRLKPHSLFASDEVFRRVKQLADDNRIFPVTADVTGAGFLPALALQLRQRGVPVSVLDLSNVLEHVTTDRAAAMRRLADGIEALPLADDAIVHLTALRSVGGQPGADGPDWALHFVLPARELAQSLRTGHHDTKADSDRFLAGLYARHADISTERRLVVVPAGSTCAQSFAAHAGALPSQGSR